MKLHTLLGVGILLFSMFTLNAQDSQFYVSVNKDTILSGNTLKVNFYVKNVTGKFEAPDLNNYNVISGPNTSTSMSIINGEVTQQSTYAYVILTDQVGDIFIDAAYLDTGNETLETEPFSVLVLPNPEGIIEEDPGNSGWQTFDFSFPDFGPKDAPQKKQGKKVKNQKKKRKLKKI